MRDFSFHILFFQAASFSRFGFFWETREPVESHPRADGDLQEVLELLLLLGVGALLC